MPGDRLYNRQEHRDQDASKITYLVVALTGVLGLFLVSLGIHFEQRRLPSIVLITVGVACVVSITTSVLQRYLTHAAQYRQIKTDMDERLHRLLKSRFDLLASCSQAGMHHIYPRSWTAFCDSVLPERLRSLKKELVVAGINLQGTAERLMGGELNKVIRQLCQRGDAAEFAFCIVRPGSEAASYRDRELATSGTATQRARSTVDYLHRFEEAIEGVQMKIEVLSSIVPRATIASMDGDVIFYSPYFSSSPTSSAWVIETHKGSPFFDILKADLDYLRSKAEPLTT